MYNSLTFIIISIVAKKLMRKLKVQVPAGQATPAPPLGPTLGQAGIPIGEFVNQFNERTKEGGRGELLPVVVNVYEDRSFDFVIKTPLASALIMKAANIKKGSGKNKVSKAGSITKQQARDIAEQKLQDLTANDLDMGARIIEGTARSMGIETE